MGRFNDKQLEIAEKVLTNSANVVWATLMLGNFLNPKGFSLILFLGGCILFVTFIGCTLWLRRKDG